MYHNKDKTEIGKDILHNPSLNFIFINLESHITALWNKFVSSFQVSNSADLPLLLIK